MNTSSQPYRFAKYLCWFFIVLSILALCYTYYRAEIIYASEQDTRPLYYIYYIVSLAGIAFWLMVLRLKPAWQANIVTVATASIIGLYLTEAGLSVLSKYQRTMAAAKQGIDYDQRTRLQVIHDLRAEGVDAVDIMTPALTLKLKYKTMINSSIPLGGIANKTVVLGNETGRYAIYQSDQYGFNNPDTEWDVLQADWALIGDSFTEGYAVQSGEGIASQIRTLTDDTVLNLGKGNSGPLIELAILTEYVEEIQAKKVLWLYYEGNDLTSNLPNEKRHPLLMNYLQAGFSQNLIHRQTEIDDKLGQISKQFEENYKVRMRVKKELKKWIKLHNIQPLLSSLLNLLKQNNEVILDPLFTKILATAQQRVTAWGGQLYFVYLPAYSRYAKTAVIHDEHYKKKAVLDVATGLDIPIIDIHKQVFASHPDPLSLFPFRLDGHYNADGYRAVAKAIVTNLAADHTEPILPMQDEQRLKSSIDHRHNRTEWLIPSGITAE